jgi:hypothetical protein
MGADDARQAVECGVDLREGFAYRFRQEVVGAPAAVVVAGVADPVAQDAVFVEREGAQGAEVGAEGFDAHGSLVIPAKAGIQVLLAHVDCSRNLDPRLGGRGRDDGV